VKKSIKTAIFLLLALVCATGVQAQGRKIIYLQNYDKAPYHFGFLLGANFMDYNLILKEDYQSTKYYDPQDLPVIGDADLLVPVQFSPDNFESFQILGIERDTMNRMMKSTPRAGFSIGILGDLRLTEHLNLRFAPTFSLSEINYRYKIKINQLDGSMREQTPCSHNPYLTCVEFPLHLKYRSKRYNNVAAYLITGLNPKLYFSFKKKNQNFNWIKNKTFDLALELGSGFDIYNQWFKMGVEAKFGFGLFNALSEDQVYYYAHPLNGMKNKQFQISLTFE
jgi:hypothetical protein